jgi:hypothetical protein
VIQVHWLSSFEGVDKEGNDGPARQVRNRRAKSKERHKNRKGKKEDGSLCSGVHEGQQ